MLFRSRAAIANNELANYYRLSPNIPASTENTVRLPVIGKGINMTTSKLQQIAAYRIAVSLFRQLWKNGTISEYEYRKCERKIAERCNIPDKSIYREIA